MDISQMNEDRMGFDVEILSSSRIYFFLSGQKCVMVWWSWLFIDDVTADGSCWMNSENYRAILSAHIQWNAIKLLGCHFTAQMVDAKHAAKATQDF